MNKGYRGVIFDLDGTLMTSALDFSAIRSAIGCPAHWDILQYIESIPCEVTQQQKRQQVIQFELDDANESEVIDGVLSTLSLFNEQRIPMAIVTRNCRLASNIKINRGSLPIDLVLSREDAPAKPDPSALLIVAQQWQLAPHQCLYVGDYLYDLQAAKNANMASCLFAPHEVPTYHAEATWLIKDFKALSQIVLV
ncbi:putative hydrolase/phosphatase protein [Pseudoalteromonas luteoviolacea B = ATCC 29581]|nr:putative hydrolase/phosphatase protein [Pseudoalteromonas luteoviolacea B = ATCC 29581]